MSTNESQSATSVGDFFLQLYYAQLKYSMYDIIIKKARVKLILRFKNERLFLLKSISLLSNIFHNNNEQILIHLF